MQQVTTKTSARKWLVTGAVALGALVGTAGVASAVSAQLDQADTDAATTQLAQGTAAQDDTTPAEPAEVETDDYHDNKHDRGRTEELLTGSIADDVSAAALAAVPGATIERVETDDAGAAYEAHMIDGDGSPVTVTFDESLAVIEIQTGGHDRNGHGRGDRDGRGPGRGDRTPLAADVAAEVAAAAEAAVPGGTVDRVHAEDDGFEAHVTQSDDTEVEVYFDADMAVIEIAPRD